MNSTADQSLVPGGLHGSAEQRFEAIYLLLRRRICLLEYEPGKRLSETALAREFDVSRTPIRKVLGRLEVEGLVEIRHGVGTLVTNIDLAYLCEVYQMRMEIVCQLGLMSPLSPTPQVTRRIRATLNKARTITEAENPKRRFAEVNIEFFDALMELVGNRAMREVAALLFYRSSRMWPFLMQDEVVPLEAEMFCNEIRETLQLLESGQLAAVGHLRRRHIAMALSRLKLMSPDSGLVA
jgi:DNA-binding GntR family transcriptional regulator